MSKQRYQEGQFRPPASTGPLFSLVLKSEGPSRLRVAVIHDMLEYHRYQKKVGEGIARHLEGKAQVHWMDLPGHGLSSGGRHHIGSFTELLGDLEFFLRDIAFADALKSERRLVVASGLGALAILRLLQTRDLGGAHPHGLVLANPLIRPLVGLPKVGGSFLRQWRSHVGKVRIPLPARSLWVHGREILEEQCSDPLIGTSLSLESLMEINDNAEIVRRESFFTDIPTLIQVGGLDPIADATTTRIFHKGLGAAVATWCEYPSMAHDLYNDEKADRPLADLYNWIDEKLT